MTLYNANTVSVGNPIKSSDLASLAQAFNSRILEAAGDSHWRIPYYIYNAYFAKPRLDNSNQYTPESEFFDFYQFVNPSTNTIWPITQPQTPEGANLQTNPLNRFIFGMDFKEKDASGNWIFERENVKVGNAREKLNTDISGDISSFRGRIFPFFLTVGSSSPEYTAWGLASNAFSNAYVNGNTQNPTGHSFGGYYGLSSFITDPVGCGSDSVRVYPKSKATLFPIDGTQTIEKYVCDEGAALNSYNTLTSESSTYPGSFKYSENGIPKEYFAKNRYHKGQNLSTVYFGREQKNHIRRLIYNYITYAKGFDFDFFFSSQYAYAPELGQFQSLTAYYDGDNNLVSIKDVNISSLRPSFTDITLNTDDSKFISIDNTSITSKDSIASGASINKKRLGTSDNLGSITGADDVYNFLWETGLTSTPNRIDDIFKIKSVTQLKIPGDQNYANGIFTFHHYAVSTSTLESFTLNVYVKDDQDNIIYEQSDAFDYSNLSEKNTRLIRSFIINGNYNISFKISDVTLKEGVAEGQGSIVIEPVFLLTYKPGINDAYALIRTCTYLNHDDEPGEANFDSENHPLTGTNEINGALGEKITNDLKKYGLVTSQSVSNIEGVSYDPTEASINTNPVFEAARRLSLFTRILGGNNFIDIETDGIGKTLKFKRYARQGYNSRLQQTDNDVLVGTTFLGLRFFDKNDTKLPGSDRDILKVEDFDATYLYSLDIFFGDYNESYPYRRNYTAAKKYIVTRNQQNLIINGVEVESGKPLGYDDPNTTGYVESFKIYSNYDTLLLKRDASEVLQQFKFFQFENIRGAKSPNAQNVNVFYSENSLDINTGNLTEATQGYEEDGDSILLGEIGINQKWEIYIFQRDGVNSVLQSLNVPTNSPALYTVTNTGEFLTEPNVVSNINALYSANYSNLAARYSSGVTNNDYSLSSFEGQLPHLLSDYSNILSGEILTGLKYIEIELALDGRLATLYNLFYGTSETSISLDEYNTKLAGFNLALSYFSDTYSLNTFKDDLNSGNITKNDRTDETDEKAKSPFLKVYNGVTEVSSSNLSFHNYFVLPSLEAGQTLKLSVPVNLYTNNTGNTIYLLGKPFIYSESNPAAIAIVKSGSLLIQNIVQEYQENPALPQQRDIFQGIVGENANENGIIEIAPAGGFTNEWVLWMNFLPYSGAETSVYKESVYGATASPFIDRCHIRSGVLRKSSENFYFNLGQELSYTPVAPPSYRYAPLFVKGKINFENIVSSEDAGAPFFYQSCAAFKKPYKVKKAYYKTGAPDVVYIELDRQIEGYPNLAYLPNSEFGYRTDANGLVDWVNRGTGVGKQSFRLGDVSITHDVSRNAVLEASTNGFKGSYYPRFFFLKLIPSPYLDGNSTQDTFDSPAYHRELKQAELYLNAMREGFALTSGGRFMSGVPCFNLNGHLTPPDYSYEQLIFNATTIDNDHYGNVWPSLQTFSSNKNEKPLRPDNPQGFGAIINNGTYAEHYNTIARAINKLTYFRVPMPLRYTATENTYYSISTPPDNTPPTPSLVNSFTVDLRNQNGEVLSVGSSTRRGYNLNTFKYYWEAKQIVLNVSRNTTLINNAYNNISSMIGTDNIVAYDFQRSYLVNKLIASSDNQIEGCVAFEGLQLAGEVDNSSPACFLGSSFTLQPPPSTNIELIINHGGTNCNTSENLAHTISVYENSFIIVSPTINNPQNLG